MVDDIVYGLLMVGIYIITDYEILIKILLAYLTVMLLIIQVKKDRSIGNFTWGGFVMIVALYTFFIKSTWQPGQIVATTLIMLWGVRLAVYAYLRYKKGADPRFVAWQQQRGFVYTLLANFVWIFVLNGFMGLIMSFPIFMINNAQVPYLGMRSIIAIIVWLIGFFWESVGDYQLYVFRKNPANTGKVLDTGLWRYSRHPNYFGEILMWWAMYLLSLVAWNLHHLAGWLIPAITPVAITVSLIFVTGIPWLEKAMASNPAYQEYKKRTSMLIPWWPKK